MTLPYKPLVGTISCSPEIDSLPRGSWEFNCRLLDPVTGGELALDVNGFEVQ